MNTNLFVLFLFPLAFFISCDQRDHLQEGPELKSDVTPHGSLFEETNTYDLRLTTHEWDAYLLHYQDVTENYAMHAEIEKFKQVMLNAIVLNSNFLTADDVDRDDVLYITEELHALKSAAYPESNYLILEKLVKLSNPAYMKSQQFIEFANTAYQKGVNHRINKVDPILESLEASDRPEKYKREFLESYDLKYNHYLPKIKTLIAASR